MQIARLDAKRLFGLFDHHIPFKIEDRITIIHGPNGVGKTTLLKLLLAVFSKRFGVLQQTPFERIEIAFDDDSVLTIERSENAADPNSAATLKFAYVRGTTVEKHTFERNADVAKLQRRFPPSMIEDIIGPLKQINAHQWVDAKLCCGHDLIELLGIGLRQAIGSKPEAIACREHLESMLRLAFDHRDFAKTRLFELIQEWQQQNSPYQVLRN